MRYGRLNKIEIQVAHVVKTCVVKETSRPQKLYVEKWALEQSRREGIQTPRVISYSFDENEILEMERVPGCSLGYRITDKSIDAFSAIGEQLARRRTDHIGYGWINPATMQGIYLSWLHFLYEYAETYTAPLVKSKVIDSTIRSRLLDALIVCDELGDAPSALVHRDIKPGNIIWGEQGAYLIDWENVILGDPFYDLCVYRCRFGTGRRWDALLEPAKPVSKHVETLYLAVALVGLIDFCITYKYGIRQKSQQLRTIIERL